MFVVHTSNCHGQNCTRRAIFRLEIDMLIANILVIIIIDQFSGPTVVSACVQTIILSEVTSDLDINWHAGLRRRYLSEVRKSRL